MYFCSLLKCGISHAIHICLFCVIYLFCLFSLFYICILPIYGRLNKYSSFCELLGICGILPFCGLQEICTRHTGASSAHQPVLKGYCFACFRTLRHTAVLRASRNRYLLYRGELRASDSSQRLLFCVLQDFAAYCRFAGFKKWAA